MRISIEMYESKMFAGDFTQRKVNICIVKNKLVYLQQAKGNPKIHNFHIRKLGEIMKKYVWIRIVVIFLILIIVFYIWYFNPKVIFQRKFRFNLPDRVGIINKSYSLFDDYQDIIDGINDYAEGYYLREVDVNNEETPLTIRAFCVWRDKETEKAVLAYCAFRQSPWGAKTRTVAILVTQNNEGQYFLHIYY